MSITDFDESYDKLGGWLILPAILHPLIGAGQSVYGAFETLSLFSDRLPAPNQVFIMSIGLGLVALAIGWAAALYYACTINPIFPKFYIWLTIISILSGIVAVVTSHILFRVEANPSDYKDVVQSIMVGCIWVPYMLVSKRVKATFYGIPFPKKPPRSAFAPLDLKGDARNAPREINAEMSIGVQI